MERTLVLISWWGWEIWHPVCRKRGGLRDRRFISTHIVTPGWISILICGMLMSIIRWVVWRHWRLWWDVRSGSSRVLSICMASRWRRKLVIIWIVRTARGVRWRWRISIVPIIMRVVIVYWLFFVAYIGLE